MTNCFILLAAGKGKRFKSNNPKQFINYINKPLFMHSVDKARKSKLFKSIIIVSNIPIKNIRDKSIQVIKGGKERYQSSHKALNFIKNKKFKNVFIHDAARPNFSIKLLKKLNFNLRKREINFKKHTKYLSKYADYFILPKQLPKSRSGWLAYPITIKEKAPFTRTDMQIFLEKRNIQTRVVFTGNITKQPGFKKIKCIKSKKGYPEADKVMKNGILLACHHGLSDKMIKHIHTSIDKFVESKIN